MNSPTPTLSILISVYGQVEMLRKCLDCVKQSLPAGLSYEVLLIDDASDHETVSFLKSLESPHVVHFNDERQGFAKNNNRMARLARGNYLCLLNSDAYVRGNWFFPMLEVFEKRSKVGFVGNLQRLAGSIRYDHMGVVFGPGGNPRHFGQGFFFHPFRERIRQWSAVTAACTLVRKENFLECGGFDEKFVNGCEDVDLCLRMSRAGYCHFVAHDSVIEHVKGASDGRKKYNDRNFKRLIDRWGSSIRYRESVSDQTLYAITYFHQCVFAPHKANLSKFIIAFLILCRLKRLGTPTKVLMQNSPSTKSFDEKVFGKG